MTTTDTSPVEPWEPDYGATATNTTPHIALAHAVETARRWVCAYWGDPCDCKYGATTATESNSEQTGCPELRELAHRLLHRPDTLTSSGEDT